MPIVQDVFNNIKEIKTADTFESNASAPINTPAHDSDSTETDSADNAILRDCVRSVLTNYINDLEGHTVDDLYQLVLAEVEAPLLETILGHTNGNQSKAAQMLGINRGTLRKKLKQYNINE
ncbi:DNA-binding transcriptional regulator Fis [sulfur-oxidizing endosymbiont of Gigantopelta aegis]|uniref:DNA-binding transcriptional regulator Fis n=1 Tax=sulfur-oxidizing endosymbiont of Gigantopelta aegis TaxID=2794934 RepID=UPI0018DB4BDE|nr:DNA-binding transcriptional regulator Fis [sulfur-oxidizing endosymbiont of Gigantopelta aegis]